MTKLISLFKLLGYTLAYLFGRRSALEEVQADANKQVLEETTKILVGREKVRAKYDKLKIALPNNWDTLKRVRKTRSD